MNKYQETYRKWSSYPELAPELKAELKALANNPQEIDERFYKSLEFGTGGLRGLLGAGTNRMNIYTVRKATLGLANYLQKLGTEAPLSVVIAYDTRHKSRLFALESALVLAYQGIKAYLFQEVTPTPILSYAVTKLKATAGIVITASHNPKDYNGYKVYWSYGGQITDEKAHAITAEINKIEDELRVPVASQREAETKGLLQWLDEQILSDYLKECQKLLLRPELFQDQNQELKIVYTPLHGTGSVPVAQALRQAGCRNLTLVPQQTIPDPEFPTVTYPNPEEPAAFQLALELAAQIDAQIIMATDPDADRVGVMVKNSHGEYTLLTGNQLGALLIDYIVTTRYAQGNLPADSVIIKTIVTAHLGVDIGKKYGVPYLDVLTGFKYIGEKIAEFQEKGTPTYLFGYEESYGYLIGDFVRDKDAVQTCLIAAEMALYYQKQGFTLLDRLQQLFQEYGYYLEDLVNISLTGIEGQRRIEEIMKNLRANTPQLAGFSLQLYRDYDLGLEKNLFTGQEERLTLPKSNVLHYTLADGSWFCVRPSGTEPKLKLYFSVKASSKEAAEEKLRDLKIAVEKILADIPS